MHYINYTVDHTKVVEGATNFLYQLDLSAQIATIDAIIDTAGNIVVCQNGINPSSAYPRYVIYEAGVKCLIYWDAPISATADRTFGIVFDTTLSAVNSASAFTNSDIFSHHGFDVNSNIGSDYAGSYSGSDSNVTLETSAFGDGAVFNGNDSAIDLGNISELSNASQFTFEAVLNTFTTGNINIVFMFQRASTYRLAVMVNGGNLQLWNYNGASTPASLSLSGIVNNDENFHVGIIYDGTQVEADRVRFVINGITYTPIIASGMPASTADLSGYDAFLGLSGNAFYGTLDEVSWYSTPKSEEGVINRYKMLFDSNFASVSEMSSQISNNHSPHIGVCVGL